jgi:UDP:flavonoid glycosyltransferase YjiC (YdhE family)
MRVLVTSTAGAGHVYPVVPLACALRDADHDVRWAIAPQACAKIEEFGVLAVPAGLDRMDAMAQDRRELLARFMAAPPRQRRVVAHPGFVTRLAPPMLDDLVRVCDELVPDVIVHEPNEYAAAPVATARRIPHVTIGFGGPPPDEVLAAIDDPLRQLWSRLGLDLRPAAGLYDHLYCAHCRHRSVRQWPSPRCSGCGRSGFDGAVEQHAPSWLEELRRKRPCVYVNFGTEVAGFAPIHDVLEAVAPLDVDALLTVGPAIDPGSVERPPTNVRIERYIPQRFVLARSALLVSHAGSGAMLGAASRGIPQLCLPIAVDQFENADFVSAAAIGLTLEPHEVEPTTLRDAIQRLLDDPSFMDRANSIANEIAAMPPPSSHVARTEQLRS